MAKKRDLFIELMMSGRKPISKFERRVRDGLEKNTTTIETVVTDQGNGGSYCDNCKKTIRVYEHPEYEPPPEKCPGCGYKLIMGSTYIQSGGSDF